MMDHEAAGYSCAACDFWIQATGDWFCEECGLPTCDRCGRFDERDSLFLCPDCFLKEGNRLKISIRFRGRELTRQDLGTALMDRVVEMLADYADVDKSPTVEGRTMTVYLVPK